MERVIAAILARPRTDSARAVLVSPEGDRVTLAPLAVLEEHPMIAWRNELDRAGWRAHYAHERRGAEWADHGGEA